MRVRYKGGNQQPKGGVLSAARNPGAFDVLSHAGRPRFRASSLPTAGLITVANVQEPAASPWLVAMVGAHLLGILAVGGLSLSVWLRGR